MTDAMIKKGASTAECPKPENPAFVIPKPLSDSKVAIVTSASLHHEDDDDFAPSDTGYRVLEKDRRDIVVGHWSPNFDGAGFAYDMNTVFPLDRLDELAEHGVIIPKDFKGYFTARCYGIPKQHRPYLLSRTNKPWTSSLALERPRSLVPSSAPLATLASARTSLATLACRRNMPTLP